MSKTVSQFYAMRYTRIGDHELFNPHRTIAQQIKALHREIGDIAIINSIPGSDSMYLDASNI